MSNDDITAASGQGMAGAFPGIAWGVPLASGSKQGNHDMNACGGAAARRSDG